MSISENPKTEIGAQFRLTKITELRRVLAKCMFQSTDGKRAGVNRILMSRLFIDLLHKRLQTCDPSIPEMNNH